MGFVVVLAPDELPVNLLLRHQLMRRYGMNPGGYDFERPQRVLMEYLQSQRIKGLDLLSDFVEAAKVRTLYLRNDSHWNKGGNALAAQEIWSYLREIVARKD